MCSTEPAAALTAGSIFAAAGTSRKDERSLRVNAYALVCWCSAPRGRAGGSPGANHSSSFLPAVPSTHLLLSHGIGLFPINADLHSLALVAA